MSSYRVLVALGVLTVAWFVFVIVASLNGVQVFPK